MFINVVFSGDMFTQWSHNGILIFINNASIYWYSKQQATGEAPTFGSEFVALQIVVEINNVLRYKLQMIDIPINDLSNVLYDNNSVVYIKMGV